MLRLIKALFKPKKVAISFRREVGQVVKPEPMTKRQHTGRHLSLHIKATNGKMF